MSPSPSEAAARHRSASAPRVNLVPREHGAWAQLCLPLGTALLALPVHLAGVLLALGSVAAFLGQEPLRVVLGHRGRRAQQNGQVMARARMWQMGALALASGGAGIVLMPAPTRWTVIVPASLAVIVGGLVLARREKSAVGELLVAFALTACALPVAAADGGLGRAGWLVGTFAVAFVLATLAVRVVIAHRRRPAPFALRLPLALVALAVPGATFLVSLPAPAALALAIAVSLAPLGLTVAALVLRPPHPRWLRQVGWTLAAQTTVVGVALIIGLRLSGG